jgi:hypothetical protein
VTYHAARAETFDRSPLWWAYHPPIIAISFTGS